MARLRSVSASSFFAFLLSNLLFFFLPSCGGSGNSGGGGGGGNPPATPSGLTAASGNQQVSLSWNAVSSASSYNVKRATASGGPYTKVATVSVATDVDTGLTNGTPYYYVVSAVNVNGESGNSSQASATPVAAATNVSVAIDVLANRHTISPYVYGGAFPKDASTITDSGLSVVRWGGNASSTYNWQLGTYNADNDYFFEDFAFGALNNSADSDSAQFIKDVKSAGSVPLMTMVMLPWVAQSPETSTQQGTGPDNNHWTFPASLYPSQCSFDQFNNSAGNGIVAGTCNNSSPTYISATQSDIERTYFPLLDAPGSGDPPGTVYRSQWVTDPTKGLNQAFGAGTCPIPYTPIVSCHFYDMDNEIDIWGGTHRDVHPAPTTFDELRKVYLDEAAALKGWDSAAVRLGPVSCCWYFYWRSATGASDTSSHGGVDFLPWWLNEVAWSDAASGSRTLDMFDIHAYPDADTNGLSQAQLKALAVKIYRDWWDPTFNSAAAYIVGGGFSNEPLDGKPFRIPRMRALLNQIYPRTGFAITEWSADFASPSNARDSDFSTALGDADAYGILGRERVSLATRWEAPSPSNPNYQALKLYTRYDGTHGFGTTSVAASHNADPGLFSTYAALNSSGTVLMIMVLNKDPSNAVQVTFATTGFNASGTQTAYTLSQSSPTAITSASGSWSSTQTFAAYTATLLVVNGNLAGSSPSAEWDLNPDTVMVPAGGTVTLHPMITSGGGNVTLSNAAFDAYEGASACSGSLNITTAAVTATSQGAIDVNAGNTPAFCHFAVTGIDNAGVTQTQGGWIVVGKPPATLAATSGNQSGAIGTQLNVLATLAAGQSGGTNTGASVLFSTTGGTLSNGTVTGNKVIAVTDSGVASVTLTLPATAGMVTVTAEGPYGLGHPIATFTETAQ